MELPQSKAAEGEREFRVEVDILSRLDHPNLVSLVGYCADGKHRFLVYEYMRKGNLQDHLNGCLSMQTYLIKILLHPSDHNLLWLVGTGEVKMDWSLRLKVAIGAARGLEYLHSSSSVRTPIVHRDFKSTNILLDSNYEAKVYQLCSLLISVYDPKCFLEASLSDLRVFS